MSLMYRLGKFVNEIRDSLSFDVQAHAEISLLNARLEILEQRVIELEDRPTIFVTEDGIEIEDI